MIGKKQNLSTLLGIAFEGKRVHIAQVRRAGERFEAVKEFSFDISGNPMRSEPGEIGLQIKEALLKNGIKERRCIVALPLRSALSLQTKLPSLAENDVADFLALEAERNFAYDPESLLISTSQCGVPSGDQYANILGIQREHLSRLLSTLQLARLKPISFTLGLAAIQKLFAADQAPMLMLVPGKESIEIGITCQDGLVAMRTLESAEAADAATLADSIGRELRVTLGQLDSEFRGRLVNARILGSTEQVDRLRSGLAPRLRAMGLELEAIKSPSPQSANGEGFAALAAAGAFLTGKKPDFEFLPPKTSTWKEFANKASSRKLAWAAGIAGGAFLILLVAFLIQGWQLSKYQSLWDTMSPKVTELDGMQQQIKRFRPWYDNSHRSLTILRKLTEAFPVEGMVTAKTVEIRNQQVTCSGVARDNQALFNMLDLLRSTKEVADVKMDQIRGKSPIQFSFNFRWVEGGAGER